MDARDILIAPLISEKSMAGTMVQQYTFEVHPRATKTQIRDAVQSVFGVSVLKVNTVNVGGKSKSVVRRGRRAAGSQSDWKKAIVTIKPGEKIELGGVNFFEQ